MSTILKSAFHSAVADGIYREIVNNSSRYYYFLGKTLPWGTDTNPDIPLNSVAYENTTRNEIITLKRITPSDVSFVIPRIDWATGTIYDRYDDSYGSQIAGVDIVTGGTGYTLASVYIGSQGYVSWAASTSYTIGQLIKSGSVYYGVVGAGTSGSTAPTHLSGSVTNGTTTLIYIGSLNNGNGSGATATPTISGGRIVDITITAAGTGYTQNPTVTIIGNGTGCTLSSVIVTGNNNNALNLEDSKFYVITDDLNVYKCLDNNKGASSTVKPYGTSYEPFTTSDGYVWKYLYNVPVALRNKFLTPLCVPVTTAIKNQYYNGGKIQNVLINSIGSGYTSGTISVSGDGYLESDPIFLTGYNIVSGGSGYTTPTISIDSPFTGVNTWVASTAYTQGQRITYGFRIYEVIVSGTSSTSYPSHRVGTVANGAAMLKFVGYTANGTVTVTSGAITGVTLNGLIRQINVTNGGSGYTTTPTVTVSGNGTAYATISSGIVTRVTVLDSGENYTSVPTVTIGTQYATATTYTAGTQIFYSNRLYTVTVGGTTGSTAPTHTSGSATNGTATLTYAGVAATAQAVLKYGAGYSSQPAVTVSSGTASISITSEKSEALLTPIFNGGYLDSVYIENPGIGYTRATLTVNGDGSNASISADLSIGTLDSQQSNIELLTVDGALSSIQVISGGYDYTTATVSISGDGTGATASANIVSGRISSITITNYGSGYRWATAIIAGNGLGAKVRVILSPIGGHGKHSISELLTRQLMLYSNISSDKNQGFDVNNDYRQIGILKNPLAYNTNSLITGLLESSCFVVSGTINISLFPADTLLTSSAGKRYRIVSNTGTSALIQSIDNEVPVVGNNLSNSANNSFNITSVTNPTVDKYSGDLMYIDNKVAFTPSSNQSVLIRTVIKF